MPAVINYEACTSCGICASACPEDAISCPDSESGMMYVHEGPCVNCGICAQECPSSAITIVR